MITNDVARCVGKNGFECPLRFSCSRHIDVDSRTVYSWVLPPEEAEWGDCDYYIRKVRGGS